MAKKFFLSKKIKNSDNQIISSLDNIKELQKFYQENKFEQPVSHNNRLIMFSLILTIIVSMIISFTIFFLFFSGFFSQTKIFSWLRIDSFMPASNITIERKEQTTVMADERISDVLASVAPSIVNIFSFSKTTAPGSVLNQTKNYLGSGVVLTNDGWIVFGNILKTTDNYVAVQDNGIIFKVTDIKQDLNLGLSFLKVDANNLSVVPLVKRAEINPAESVLIIDGLAGFNRFLFLSRISDNRLAVAGSSLWESEKNYLFLSLEKTIGDSFLNAPVFSLNKELAGFIVKGQGFSYVIPTDYFKKSFTQLLTLKSVKQTYLGLVYMDLSSNFIEGQPRKGALVTTIKNDSPLKKLNVASGDLIIKINDDLLDSKNNLSNLIQSYRPGDKIKLTIINKSDQKEREVSVELK